MKAKAVGIQVVRYALVEYGVGHRARVGQDGSVELWNEEYKQWEDDTSELPAHEYDDIYDIGMNFHKATNMGYKLFIDDEREPVGDDWVIARSSFEAASIVTSNGMPNFISFDHDLGDDDTAMGFLNWLSDTCLDAGTTFSFDYTVHSQNPVGRDNIIGFIESFKRSQK